MGRKGTLQVWQRKSLPYLPGTRSKRLLNCPTSIKNSDYPGVVAAQCIELKADSCNVSDKSWQDRTKHNAGRSLCRRFEGVCGP
jgi:hypothetical protein